MGFPHIRVRNLGPIKNCDFDIKPFTVLTGPQACGKSTIAKILFYFTTIKDDVFAQLNFKPTEFDHETSILKDFKKRLRNKFLGIFGSTWSMPDDFAAEYCYNENTSIKIYLYSSPDGRILKFLSFDFSQNIIDFLNNENSQELNFYNGASQSILREKINLFFSDNYEVVYIPAGRSMISTLTDSLNYIFSSMDDMQRRTIDYCTQSYVNLILKLKPTLTNGLEGLLQDKLHLTQDKVDRNFLKCFLDYTNEILKGKYKFTSGEERLEISEEHYVKINFSSSGQQEIVWVLNIMFYYLLNRKRTFLILEEPESHLYPDAQKYIAEVLGLFIHANNGILVTTHSPYILGEFNNMLYANEISDELKEERNKIINDFVLLPYEQTSAYFINEGEMHQGIAEKLIMNSLIDGASESINEQNEKLMELKFRSKISDKI